VVDQVYNATLQSEQALADLSEHMLLGVATKYQEQRRVEMADGVRKTDAAILEQPLEMNSRRRSRIL
jgi:putative salt-induced outer membrane protein YdiY